MRDPAFYDRDTFNNDRIEVMRGSASMLFGRGSTGGAVNQVSKVPRLITDHEVSTTLGSHDFRRVTGRTRSSAALRPSAYYGMASDYNAGSASIATFSHIHRFGGGSKLTTPVTRGARLAAFFWVESMVRVDPQRRLLHEFDLALTQLRETAGDSETTVTLVGTYHNLLRMWSET